MADHESLPCGRPIAFIVVLTAIVTLFSAALLVAFSRSNAVAADISVRVDALNTGYSELSADRDRILAVLADLTFAVKENNSMMRKLLNERGND